jgi:hypothetical protein
MLGGHAGRDHGNIISWSESAPSESVTRSLNSERGGGTSRLESCRGSEGGSTFRSEVSSLCTGRDTEREGAHSTDNNHLHTGSSNTRDASARLPPIVPRLTLNLKLSDK